MQRIVSLFAALVCALLSNSSAWGFSLLGPYAPWMTTNLSYHQPGDIGGPMDLHEGYRWNLPTLTYGFDRSFLDYFGPQGVAAVEDAIQILNALPPASEMDLTSYPLSTRRINYAAQANYLADVKSTGLRLLIQQLGLAEPVRNVCVLHQWFDPSFFPYPHGECCLPANFCPDYGYRRNYDPTNLQWSRVVNDATVSFQIAWYSDHTMDAVEVFENPYDPRLLSVADGQIEFGMVLSGLTRDDVGGLRYLLNRTNIQVEELAGQVLPAAGNTNALVRLAPRPGVERITFLRHPTNSTGGFVPLTNQFQDIFLASGLTATQAVQRVVSNPDILFSAQDLGVVLVWDEPRSFIYCPEQWRSTDTFYWRNFAAENGKPSGLGPGVIQPPVRIAFNTPGKYWAAMGGSGVYNYSVLWNWGRFDTSTNAPITLSGSYPLGVPCTLSTQLVTTNGLPRLEWTWFGQSRSFYQIETSTNLPNWSVLQVGTNLNGVVRTLLPATQPHQFFRAVAMQTP